MSGHRNWKKVETEKRIQQGGREDVDGRWADPDRRDRDAAGGPKRPDSDSRAGIVAGGRPGPWLTARTKRAERPRAGEPEPYRPAIALRALVVTLPLPKNTSPMQYPQQIVVMTTELFSTVCESPRRLRTNVWPEQTL